MLKTNWKGNALMAGISAVSVFLLLSAVVSAIHLVLFTGVRINSWLLLLLLTLATSRLTVRVRSADGLLRSRESIDRRFGNARGLDGRSSPSSRW
jgi:hypothetical protein